MTRQLDAIGRQVSTAVRRAVRDPESHRAGLRRAAELLVEARLHFLTAEGEPDWKGRTYAYRTWYGGLLSDAGLSPAERETVSATIRYHVGNVMRERLSPEELAEAGLSAPSPIDRARLQRDTRAAIVRSVKDAPAWGGVDALRALTVASALVDAVEPEALSSLSPGDGEAAKGLLTDLSASARRLARALK